MLRSFACSSSKFFSCFFTSAFYYAGQTQGMTVTDYVPDKFFYYTNGYNERFIDINGDGIADIKLIYHAYYDSYVVDKYYLLSLNPYTQLEGIPDSGLGGWWHLGNPICAPLPYQELMISELNDTIFNNSHYWFLDYAYALENVIFGPGQTCLHGNLLYFQGSDYYFSGRYISSPDTLLFYIHLSAHNP